MGACYLEEVHRLGYSLEESSRRMTNPNSRRYTLKLFSWCAGPGDKLHWGSDPLWACHWARQEGRHQGALSPNFPLSRCNRILLFFVSLLSPIFPLSRCTSIILHLFLSLTFLFSILRSPEDSCWISRICQNFPDPVRRVRNSIAVYDSSLMVRWFSVLHQSC